MEYVDELVGRRWVSYLPGLHPAVAPYDRVDILQGARAEIGEGATVVSRAAADGARVAAVDGAGPRAVERVASGAGTMAGGIG